MSFGKPHRPCTLEAMSLLKRRIAQALPIIVLITVVVPTAPASSTTQAEVDAACAESSQALDLLEAARVERDAAQARYAEIIGQREETAYLELRLRDQIQDREDTTNEVRDRVVQRAVDIYMSGGSEITELVFGVSSVDQIVAGQEFLEAVTSDDLASADQLSVVRSEMEVMRADLADQQRVLLDLEAEAEDIALALEQSAQVARDTYETLDGDCRTLYAKRQNELAAARAREAARRGGGGGGIPAEATPGFICPMDGWATSFINDWGFPRSGGRSHKGTDVFAPMGQPVYAVADGSVSLGNGGLGGTTIWLTADYGVAFYYAHLSGFANVSSGQRVSKGQLIGYNGNSGNARGGSPHLHFQIRPGGRSGVDVNPYYTLARTCR
jgi:murein DD-endopeptidase MepM/ murein hydrolase activator NlpD